ncbi:SDR family NAD(P)-dependent oxidoreductase [Streptomyces sp. NBC_00454]|uniref:SDR family NAD(P)-dependent oxidoreductase n=1 Tax=Streptomyces sp. NBC_00454 TaxID=2975747 RepID=UPI002F914B56
MIERRWGRIVNIGSVNARAGRTNLVAYSAAKAGLLCRRPVEDPRVRSARFPSRLSQSVVSALASLCRRHRHHASCESAERSSQ